MKLFKRRASNGPRRHTKLWLLRVRKLAAFVVVFTLVSWSAYEAHNKGALEKTSLWLTQKTFSTTAAAGFRVNDILVTGRTHISQEEMLQKLAVRRGVSIFAVDLEKAQQDLSGISWTKSVRVSRRLPDKIAVALEERAPAALWQHQKKLALVDIDGHVLTGQNLEIYRALPLVVGENAEKNIAPLLELLKAEPALAAKVSSAVFIGKRRWDLHLQNNIIVKLPEENTGLAFSRLARAQESGKILDKAIRGIDLRIPEKMVVTTAPSEKVKA